MWIRFVGVLNLSRGVSTFLLWLLPLCRTRRLQIDIPLDLASQDVQNGRPARPQGQEAPEAYPLGYVEDASEPRTRLAAVFNILLSRQSRNLDHRPNFDGPLARPGNPREGATHG